MGSEEEEEVDEGSVETCLLGLSWEFSCKEEEGVKCLTEGSRYLASEKWVRSRGARARVVRSQEQAAPQHDLKGRLVCREPEQPGNGFPEPTPMGPAYLLTGITRGRSCQGWPGAL